MAGRAGLAAPLCSEQFGSRAARGCCAAADGRLQWEAWGGLPEAFKVKPEGRDGGAGGAPAAASPLASRLLTVFLPQGFPESVSPDYLPYQLWDSVQVSGAASTGGAGHLSPRLQTGRVRVTHQGELMTDLDLRAPLTRLLCFPRPLPPASPAPWPLTRSSWA